MYVSDYVYTILLVTCSVALSNSVAVISFSISCACISARHILHLAVCPRIATSVRLKAREVDDSILKVTEAHFFFKSALQ